VATRQIPWTRVLVEGVVIVASILLALAADAWRQDRTDRREERAIIGRLISDLEADQQAVDQGLRIVADKQARLQRVRTQLDEAAVPEDPIAFLGDVVRGATLGWNQSVPRSVTFDELLGSGEFALIRDSGIRELLSSYYSDQETAGNRIDERETGYPSWSYQMVPRSSEFEVATDLGPDEARRIATDVLLSLPRGQVTAELNLAQFIGEIFEQWGEDADELLKELESYRDLTN